MIQNKENPITYASVGVDYDLIDSFKRLAQLKARVTSENLNRHHIRELDRGESAYVWEEEYAYRAFVVEGLGTKNRIADEMRKITGKTYYDQIAQDTVAMIVNDLITVGADPQVINAYFAVGSADWFLDEKRTEDLVDGWAQACNLGGASWGGGETPVLKGVIEPEAIDLAGAAIGIIKPKSRLASGNRLMPGDSILLVESSGIHANGLTMARAIVSKLPEGYATRLPDGRMYGEALLVSTHIYAGLIKDLLETNMDIHYMVNITGHGWRKLMRAKRDLSYIIDRLPEPQPIFDFIKTHSGNEDYEMYGNFNMGGRFCRLSS